MAFERLRARLAPQPRMRHRDYETGLKWWMRNGLGSQTMDTLTVGAFLTAFALDLGASNILIGVLAAVPHLTQVLQIPGVYIDDRWRNRRAVSVLLTGISRPMYLLMAAAAFVTPPALALTLFTLAFTVRYALTAPMSCGWHSWIRDLVPDERRGRLTGRRLAMMSGLSIVLGLAAASFVDVWKAHALGPPAAAYSILFVIAFLGGAYSTWCMTRMPEPQMPAPREQADLIARLREPYRDANYRRLLVFLGTWNFAVNLAAPFFMVHMLQRLGLELWVVMALTLLSQATNVMVLRHWGEIADRMSNKAVLGVCAPLFIACIFAWTFTTFPEKHAFTLPLLVVIHMLTGIATAGVTLASGNIAMKLAPRGAATTYLANNALVTSLASGVAPLVGGVLAHFFMVRELTITLRWRAPAGEFAFDTLSISAWDFFFLIATVIGLFAVSWLARVHEVGEAREGLVISETYLQAKRFVQNVSSIAGLHQGGEIPFPLNRTRRRRRAKAAAARGSVKSGEPGTDPEA